MNQTKNFANFYKKKFLGLMLQTSIVHQQIKLIAVEMFNLRLK